MNSGLKLTTANQSELNIHGIVLCDFGVTKNEMLFQIPVIVTNDTKEDMILGYNVIEHLLMEDGKSPRLEILRKISDLSDREIKGVVDEITVNWEKPNSLGNVKTTKDVLIPAQSVHRVKCRVKVNERRKHENVLIVPTDENEIGNGWCVLESPETLKPGKNKNVGEAMELKRGAIV